MDVSGSMERYARLLLAFLHAATARVRGLSLRRDVFAFGTRLTDLTPAFRLADTDAMLVQAGRAIQDFAGGTRLGDALATLRQRHARRILWLNPLLRYDGYAPSARGAAVLHRAADGMLAVHNVTRLQELAGAIATLIKP